MRLACQIFRNAGTKAQTDFVAVIDKALDLLECLADGGDRSVAELSEAAGISKAAAYRILHTLERRGFVVTYDRVRRYRIGHALLAYGEAARHSDQLLAIARPVMRALWKYSGETVNLGVRSRGQVLYLEALKAASAYARLVKRARSTLSTQLPSERRCFHGFQKAISTAPSNKPTSSPAPSGRSRTATRYFAQFLGSTRWPRN